MLNNMEIKRGDIYLVDFYNSNESSSKNKELLSAVVLSHNAINRARSTVIIIPLSTSPRSAPPLVITVPSAGKDIVALCDQVTSVNKTTRLKQKLGTLSAPDLLEIERAIAEILHIAKR